MSVIKETVEVVAPARISAEKEIWYIIPSLSSKNKTEKAFFFLNLPLLSVAQMKPDFPLQAVGKLRQAAFSLNCVLVCSDTSSIINLCYKLF